MAFSSEVAAKFTADTTAWQKAITKTKADVADLAQDTERKLRRSWGGDDAIKGLMMGLGIGSVEQAVRTIVGYFEEAAKEAKEMAEWTERMLALQNETKDYKLQRTDEEMAIANVKKLRKELGDLLAEKKKISEEDKQGAEWWDKSVAEGGGMNVRGSAWTKEKETELRKKAEDLQRTERDMAKKKRDDAFKGVKEAEQNYEAGRKARLEYLNMVTSLEEQLSRVERERAEAEEKWKRSGTGGVAQSEAFKEMSQKMVEAEKLRSQLEERRISELNAAMDREEKYLERVGQIEADIAKTKEDTIMDSLSSEAKIVALKRMQLELQKQIREESDPERQAKLRLKFAQNENTMQGLERSQPRLTLGQIAGMSPRGRRSERERIAARSEDYSKRADKAEAQGNFSYAKQLRGWAARDEAKVGASKAGITVHDPGLTKVIEKLMKPESIK